MDQLSRNVRLCQKNRTFLSISRDATQKRRKKIYFFQEIPEKTKYLTTYFYCTIRYQVLDLSSNKKIKQIYGKAFLYFLTLKFLSKAKAKLSL